MSHKFPVGAFVAYLTGARSVVEDASCYVIVQLMPAGRSEHQYDLRPDETGKLRRVCTAPLAKRLVRLRCRLAASTEH